MSGETVGDRLRSFAVEKFGTATALARAVGFDPSALTQYMKNRRKLTKPMYDQLENLGCNIAWLMGEDAVEKSEIQNPEPQENNELEFFMQQNVDLMLQISLLKSDNKYLREYIAGKPLTAIPKIQENSEDQQDVIDRLAMQLAESAAQVAILRTIIQAAIQTKNMTV